MDNPITNLEQQIEAYRDGLGSDADRRQFEERVAADPWLRHQFELADRVDESLIRYCASPSVDTSFLPTRSVIQDDAQPVIDVAPARTERSKSRALFLAIAASLAWIVVAAQLLITSDESREIAFRERPLTEVYTECVNEGFKPYWVCEDEALFAATFERRQGVPLKMKDLPPGRIMVGLSYLAGISRDSTSFLALADDVPVIVFVDRIERDWKPPTGTTYESELSVKRSEKHGLVFYEVSPFAESLFIDHFMEQSP